MTEPTALATLRERAKGPAHEALHTLGPHIPDLNVGECHCNLLIEVALDAMMPVITSEVSRLTAELAEAREGLAAANPYWRLRADRMEKDRDAAHAEGIREGRQAGQEVIPILGNAVEALRALIELKDGPRDEAYERAKPSAWAAARICLRLADRALASLTPDTEETSRGD